MPNAQPLVQINGGAPQSGGLDNVPSAAVLHLLPLDITGWLAARWEWVDYPEGWATPAGWTLDAGTGIIYSTALGSPQDITLPASAVLWGDWALRVRINEQIADDQKKIAGLIDESMILRMWSPNGIFSVTAKEDQQFTTPTTRHKRWTRTLQRVLKIIDPLLAGGGGGTPWHNVPTARKTGNYNFLTSDYFVVWKGLGADATSNLPAGPTNGDQYEAKNADPTFKVTVSGNGNNIEQAPGASTGTDDVLPGQSRIYRYVTAETLWMRVG